MIEIWLQEGDGKAKKVVVGGIESLVSSGGLMWTAIGWTGPITLYRFVIQRLAVRWDRALDLDDGRIQAKTAATTNGEQPVNRFIAESTQRRRLFG